MVDVIGNWLHGRIQRKAFADFSRHDLASFLSAWAEDAVFVYPGTTSFAGRYEGKQQIQEWFQAYMDAFPRIQFTVQNVCVRSAFGLTSNLVCTQWEVAVANRDGADFQYGGITVVRLRRAKAVQVTDYIFDTSVLAQALGQDATGAPGR